MIYYYKFMNCTHSKIIFIVKTTQPINEYPICTIIYSTDEEDIGKQYYPDRLLIQNYLPLNDIEIL